MTAEQQAVCQQFEYLLEETVNASDVLRDHLRRMEAVGVKLRGLTIHALVRERRPEGGPSDAEFLRSLRIVPDVEPGQ